jgi:hypothetical protein
MASTSAIFALFALNALGLAGATSCTAADPGLRLEKCASESGVVYYRVESNTQLLALGKCTSIDYFWIYACPDCPQEAFCGLQLQSITGKDPNPQFGLSVYLYNAPGIK